MYDRTDRIAREDQAHANLTLHAARAREAGKTGRWLLLFIVALIAALLIGFNGTAWAPSPAHAATKAVYPKSVTVKIVYTPTKASDPYGQRLQQQWVDQLAKAVKAANADGSLGKVQIVKTSPDVEVYGRIVRLGSAPTANFDGNAKVASHVYLLVDPYLPKAERLLESQVTMGDQWGKAHTAAQRQAALQAALEKAIPR